MIVAARALLTQILTVAAVNAKIDALNAVYANLPGWVNALHLNQVADGWIYAFTDPAVQPPSLLFLVGLGAEKPVEVKRVQLSRLQVPVEILYVSPSESLLQAMSDTALTLEATLVTMEGIIGQTLGTTPQRGVVRMTDPQVEMLAIDATDAPTKYGFRWKCDLIMQMERTGTL